MATFLPTYAEEHHPEITGGQMGLILWYAKSKFNVLTYSMFEVAYIMAAPVIGFSLKKVGRKNYIIIGYLIVVLGTAGFAALALIENE